MLIYRVIHKRITRFSDSSTEADYVFIDNISFDHC